MAEVTLRACRFRGGRFTLAPGDEVKMSFADLLERFHLGMDDSSNRAKWSFIQPRAYLGLIKGSLTGRVVSFVILNADRGPSYSWILRKDPAFESRLLEVYRVEAVARDGELQEVEA